MAPFGFCSRATQSLALSAARHLPARASAQEASPVLLELLASVAGPPPKLPLGCWRRSSQPTASATAVRTGRVCGRTERSISTERAVTSVSGAFRAFLAPSQVWSFALGEEKVRRK